MQKLKASIFLLLLVLGVFVQCQTSTAQQSKINGVSFVASNDTIRQHHIDPVLKVSANWVSIMPFAFMKSLEASRLYYDDDNQWYGERVEGVKQSINMMHKNGIKVMLKPQIWIGGGEFTGHINLANEEDWKNFETQYAKMLLLYAKIAEETQTQMFCIGTELNSFVTKRPEFWKSLIKSVREVYSGQLTYAENWDKIENVSFWSTLDFIGVDAYFPISEAQTPQLDMVRRTWEGINERLKTLSNEHDTPVIFTEFGYRSMHFAGREPWDSKRVEGQVNELTQSILLQGLMESVWDKDWFAGGFLWKWFHDPEKLSDWQENRFSVHGKLAEKTIKRIYKNL